MKLDFVYQDDDILVVNKPPGMLAQEDRTGDRDVVRAVKRHLSGRDEENPFVGLVHRLDRPASGLMVLALRPSSAAELSKQFREHHPDKFYFAIVEGELEGIGQLEDFLLKEERGSSIVDAGHPAGKLARLNWQSVAEVDGLTLVHIQLETGRSHQVRVQLAHRGFPILGDFRYGASRELDGRNLALHAYRLTLEHPSTQKGMQWTVAPPDSWPHAFQSHINPFL